MKKDKNNQAIKLYTESNSDRVVGRILGIKKYLFTLGAQIYEDYRGKGCTK